MERNTAKRAVLMVGNSGGEVSILDKDGIVIATEGLRPGRHKAVDWVSFMGNDDTLEIGGEVSVMVPQAGRCSPMPYGEGAFDTGANPDFQVTSASRMQREMALTLARMEKRSNKLEKRIAAVNKLAKMKGKEVEVAEQENVTVIDDDDAAVVPPVVIEEEPKKGKSGE